MQIQDVSTTLIELLRRRVVCQPDRRIFTFLADGEVESAHLTYADLDHEARAVGAALQKLDLNGACALLLYPAGLEFISAFFGSLYGGIVPIPAPPPDPSRLQRTLPRLQSVAVDAGVRLGLTTSAMQPMIEELCGQVEELRSIRWLATDHLEEGLADQWTMLAVDPHAPAYLQYTSGSTSTPKGVMVSHHNLLHNSDYISRAWNYDAESIAIVWVPYYHDDGLVHGIIQPIFRDGPSFLMSPQAFIQKPVRWLRAISKYRATHTGGPNFAYDLCCARIKADECEALDLSTWQVAYNAAEPVRQETLEKFKTVFGEFGFRSTAFYPSYGLAEATLLVSTKNNSEEPLLCRVKVEELERSQRIVEASPSDTRVRTLVSCGIPVCETRIVIAEPNSLRPCDDDEVGEILISDSGVAQGYWQREEESERTFRARLADDTGERFLRTGDLGFIRHNELFITGRRKDLIIIHGQNHYPQDIEASVERSHSLLRPGCSAAFSLDIHGEEQLLIAAEVSGRHETVNYPAGGRPGLVTGNNLSFDAAAVISGIQQRVMQDHELRVYAVILLEAGSISKTSSGKIQRHFCRQDFLSGSFKVVSAWMVAFSEVDSLNTQTASAPAWSPELSREERRTAAQRYLVHELSRILKVADVGPYLDAPLSRLGFDSITAVELKFKIETDCGAIVPVGSLLQDITIAELADWVVDHVQNNGSKISSSAIQSSVYPLALNQEALWLGHQLAPQSAVYNLNFVARLKGSLNARALEHAFQRLADRHVSLRSTFEANETGPTLRVHAQGLIGFTEIDARSWSGKQLDSYVAEESLRPFDLAQGPLLRVALIGRSQDEHILLLAAHHIISDFWSLAILLQEVGGLYAGELGAETPPLELQPFDYTDFVAWQRNLLSGVEGSRQWQFWEQELAGELKPLELSRAKPRPPVRTFNGGAHHFNLDQSLTRQLKALARAEGTTLYVVLLAALQIVLQRNSGQEEILVGTPVAGRSRPEFSNVVGYFANLLIVRGDLSGNPSVKEVLKRVRRKVLGALDHQDFPFSLLVERLQPVRDPSRSPLFQHLFTLEKSRSATYEGLGLFAMGHPGAKLTSGPLVFESLELKPQTVEFETSLVMEEVNDSIFAVWQYNRDLYDGALLQRLSEQLERVLRSLPEYVERRIGSVPLLSDRERQFLLCECNASERRRGRTLLECFAEQVSRRGEAIAVVGEGGEQVTYAWLEQRANELSAYLRGRGLGAEDRVGVYLERSAWLIVALLGVAKAGAAYVPLEPRLPWARLEWQLSHGEVKLLLTETKLREQVPARISVPVLAVDKMLCATGSSGATEAEEHEWEERLAYLMYTSGTTGEPKGVGVSWGALDNFLQSMALAPGMNSADVMLAVTTISFDIAGLELWLPLREGGRLELASAAEVVDGQALQQRMRESGVTVMQGTPALWRLLLLAEWKGERGLRVLCGGERWSGELAAGLGERSAQVWNMYGPTETTIWSAARAVGKREERVAIGGVIDNTEMYVLDEGLELSGVEVWGEVWIGGAGLARGYEKRADLTAERYRPDPYSGRSGARLYGTGDVGRVGAAGQLELSGRKDEQVKVRGHRVELGEVEKELGQVAGVRQAVVVAQEEASGEQRLVGYVVKESAVGDWRGRLRERLPEYMIPSLVVELDQLPLTANGKIDRRALSKTKIERVDPGADHIPPRNHVEKLLTGIWSDLLGVESINTSSNFFELGGHSLLATQMLSRVRMSFQVELTMPQLFKSPTPALLAKAISRSQAEQTDKDALAELLATVKQLSAQEIQSQLALEQ
ncbi:MAG TPA: amino acid adenylation domain-containing protein [Pyrinomonadaceae bacterium]